MANTYNDKMNQGGIKGGTQGGQGQGGQGGQNQQGGQRQGGSDFNKGTGTTNK